VRVRLSPESLARSIKKIAPELLTITEPEVSFRKRGSIAVGEGFLPDHLGLPDRRLRNGAADRTDGDYRHRNRRSDDQLRDAAASHDRLPSMNAIAADYGQCVPYVCDGHHKEDVSEEVLSPSFTRGAKSEVCPPG